MPEPITNQNRGPQSWDPNAANQSVPPPNKCEEPPKPGATAPVAREAEPPRGTRVLVAKTLQRRSESALATSPHRWGGHEVVAMAREGGIQDEASLALYRGHGKIGSVSGTTEVGSAKISLGERAGDCNGPNASVQLNLLQVEYNVAMGTSDENSMTFGLSAGYGAELGICERDSDHDGKPERCFRVGIGPITYGECLEVEKEPAASGGDGDQGTGGAPGR